MGWSVEGGLQEKCSGVGLRSFKRCPTIVDDLVLARPDNYLSSVLLVPARAQNLGHSSGRPDQRRAHIGRKLPKRCWADLDLFRPQPGKA